MQAKYEQPWYNYRNIPYSGTEPAFPDLSDLQAVKQFESQVSIFHQELISLLQSRSGRLIDHYASEMYDPGGWSTISFKTWGIDVPANLQACPAIRQFLQAHPEVLSFSINQLKPGKSIRPHCGDTNAIWRCHAGLKVPAGLPSCGLRVKTEKIAWTKYKVFGFCDAYEHEAWNHSEENRLIICFDIIREEFRQQAKPISLHVRSVLVLQYLRNKIPLLQKTPRWISHCLLTCLRILLYAIYPYQKKKGVIIRHN